MKKTLPLLFGLLVSQICYSADSELPIKKIAEGNYVHLGVHQLPNKKNHGEIANIGFIVGTNCVAVIDSGGNPAQGQQLKKAITKITATPICYVINTHVHPDHIFGNIAFKEPGTKFVGHHKLARAMQMRGPYYISKANEQLAIKLTGKDIIVPNISVHKQMTLDLGGRKLIISAHPTAHTDNDLSVYDEKTATLWLSDLLFIGHIPVIDGSIKGWIKELERLKKLEYKTVIPGHGPVVTNWPKAMRPELDYLKTLLNGIREQIRQGKYLEDAINTVGLSEKNNWLLFDQFHKKNISSSFSELEWED
jgi:quinoprotein relay system zinc metallohydrolase 2